MRTIAVLASVLAVTAACSSSVPVPQVVLASSLEPTTADTSVGPCPVTGSWVQIGSFRQLADEKTEPVPDGDQFNGNDVGVECSVAPDGEGFLVDLEARIESGQGGSIRLQGRLNSNTEGEAQDGEFQATFTKLGFGNYSSRNCRVSFRAPGEDTSRPTNRGIAAGRVWGFIDCDPVRSASAEASACAATAQFRFERCSTTSVY